MATAPLTPSEASRTRVPPRFAERLARLYDLPSKGPRIAAMEGMRGFAVLLVFLVHFDQLIGYLLPHDSFSRKLFDWSGDIGHSGVDLFFLLSGYLIYGLVCSGRKSIPEFLRRRVQRIYPTFLVVLCCYILFMLAAPAESKFPRGVAPALLYVLVNAMLLPGIVAITPIMTVAWSLSYEIFYYAFLPAMYRSLNLSVWSRVARVYFFSGLVLAYSAYCMICGTAKISGVPIYPGKHIRLIMFVSGILVYEFTARPAHLRLGRGGENAIGLLAICAVLSIPALPSGTSFVIPILMLFICYGAVCACALTNETGPIAAAFSFTPLRWLGNMSYSYYLVHAVFVHVGRYLLVRAVHVSAAAVWVSLPMCFALTWAGATALFLAVEKPFSFARRAAWRGIP